ncbi:MAG: hypothetical protein A2898_01795 [Candidatus Kerfeldbacteria bacterium RIFCSPLOWO2_01_FULL_48_11]|uniref:Uncharacterized protein n=1 Tax=Candidatus Kerfeldbacteria bacterium RIFCSPLOWO2_01_FULL_48_11 TaxID=1798543 RepID=A0A1G2B6Y5_9BACT|nr:MAG: hypothetical protein UY52_C0021G0010 [Parcubacteria group bacterium GW2011_GWC2_49_9]OGY83987.1 MAG: hypothetical protein A2898_01795 [Candidatus Kerfeldbacteria bacterium RIFCSPLOWO2_01_FULL_48_11]HCJ52649.1 hypothetical protein [Candidatus Kerfeldbacteria bacterium]
MDSSITVRITLPHHQYTGDWWEQHQGFNGLLQYALKDEDPHKGPFGCNILWKDSSITGCDKWRRTFLELVSGRLDGGIVVQDPDRRSVVHRDLILDFASQPNPVLAGSYFQQVWCSIVSIYHRRSVLLDHNHNGYAARPCYPWEAIRLRGHSLVITKVQFNVATLEKAIEDAITVILNDRIITAAFVQLQSPPELPRTRIEAAITEAKQVRDSHTKKGPDRTRMDNVISTLGTLLAMSQ